MRGGGVSAGRRRRRPRRRYGSTPRGGGTRDCRMAYTNLTCQEKCQDSLNHECSLHHLRPLLGAEHNRPVCARDTA